MNFNIGIDIGTRNVRMAVEGYGVAFTASAAVAVRKGVDMPIAMGDEALAMRGRLSEGCAVAYPIHSGICENEALLGRWFLALFERARSIAHLRKIHVLAGCAGWIARAHRYALMQAALDAGADSVSLIRSDALAAIGAGLEVARPEASFVIEAGAGGMGAALLSFGRTVVSRQMPIGFAGVDGEIVGAMRAKGVRIGEDAAEGAKLALASASGASSGKLSVSTAGFDEKTRLPRLRIWSTRSLRPMCARSLRSAWTRWRKRPSSWPRILPRAAHAWWAAARNSLGCASTLLARWASMFLCRITRATLSRAG